MDILEAQMYYFKSKHYISKNEQEVIEHQTVRLKFNDYQIQISGLQQTVLPN